MLSINNITKTISELTEIKPETEAKEQINRKEVAKEFIRVGDQYYRKVLVPDANKRFTADLIPYQKQTIIDDYGRPILTKIKKYYGFTTVPNHLNYEEEIGGFLNKYYKIEHTPTPGEFPITENYLHHIFGEQYELGLDYLTILWRFPTKRLPILALISKEKATGKTTFLNWLNDIYGYNMLIVGNAQLESEFNDFMFGKLIIAIDETFLEKKAILERIKSLATSNSMTVNGKFKSLREAPNFIKFILTSNNVDNFINTDKEENRYWVIDVKKIEKEIPNFKEKLKKEIPAFLFYLSNREIKYPEKTRFWFDYKIYRTKALERIIEKSKPKAQRIIENFLKEIFVETQESVLYYRPKDLKTFLFPNNQKYDVDFIQNIMEKIGFKRLTTKDNKVRKKRHLLYFFSSYNELQQTEVNDYPFKLSLQDFDFDPTTYSKEEELPF